MMLPFSFAFILLLYNLLIPGFVLEFGGSVSGTGLPMHRLAKEKPWFSWVIELGKGIWPHPWWEIFSSGKKLVYQNRQVLLFPTRNLRNSSRCEAVKPCGSAWELLCRAQSQMTVSESLAWFAAMSQERFFHCYTENVCSFLLGYNNTLVTEVASDFDTKTLLDF